MVEYSVGYIVDYWCFKGYILLCFDGELSIEFVDGCIFILKVGMSYQVVDYVEVYCLFMIFGVRFFIVD